MGERRKALKISKIEAIPIRQELKEPFGNAQGWTTARQYLIVRITADDGATGYGECWGPVAGNREVVRDVIAIMLLWVLLLRYVGLALSSVVGFASIDWYISGERNE